MPSHSQFIELLRKDQDWKSGRTWREALDHAMGQPGTVHTRSSLTLEDLARGVNVA